MSAIVDIGATVLLLALIALCRPVLRRSRRRPGSGWRARLRAALQTDIVPPSASRRSFRLAPGLALGAALLAGVALPSPLRATVLHPAGLGVSGASLAPGLFGLAIALGSLFTFFAGWATRDPRAGLGAGRGLALDLVLALPFGLALMIVGMSTTPAVGLIAWPLAAVAYALSALGLARFGPFDFEGGAEGLGAGIAFSGVSRAAFALARDLRGCVLALGFVAWFLGGGRWPGLSDETLGTALRSGWLAGLLTLVAILTAAFVLRRDRGVGARIGAGALFVLALSFGLADARDEAGASWLLAASATLAVLVKLALVWRALDLLAAVQGRLRPAEIRALALRLAFPLAAAQWLWFGLFVAGGAP